MDIPDRLTCYRALQARDARFDGQLFVGVTSTGIYCRPVCPAQTAKFENCRFFVSAAAAQSAGFRPCLRCRPESAPGGGVWRGTFDTVARALELMADANADPDTAQIAAVAQRLAISDRQLRRLFHQHLGAAPVAVLQTRRVLLAKQLLHETRLPMAQVAMAAGFGSIRRFNEIFSALYGRPPGALRREVQGASHAAAADSIEPVTLRLHYRPPYDWPAMLAFLAQRAIDGVEQVSADAYLRSMRVGTQCGVLRVTHDAARRCLLLQIRFPSLQALPAIVERVRRQFDADAHIDDIHRHLVNDPLLAPLIAQRPGLRAPGTPDPFELALRAVLGQQVSVAAARRLLAQLVSLCDERLPEESAAPGVQRLFPSPQRILATDLGAMRMPGARRNTIRALARAAIDDSMLFHPYASIDDAVARLREIPGIGDWTAHYIALRALRENDAFPAADIGLQRAAAPWFGRRPTASELLRTADAWRPWRAYAAQHLWAADSPKPEGALT